MPNLDRTGPAGAGPMTGRGLGLGSIPLTGDMGTDRVSADTAIYERSMESTIDIPAEEARAEDKAFEKSVQYRLSDDEKQKIVEYIVKLVDDCTTSRADWLENQKECIDLLNGVRAPKTEPWENCSNITTMATATHAKLMHAKLFPAISLVSNP